MIEVMVALLVIAVAMFGTAKIQALTLGSTHNSSTRSLIALQASSLAAAMRANEAYWSSGSPPLVVASFSASTGVTTLDATLAAQNVDCTALACTPVQMAGYDLQHWLGASTGPLANTGLLAQFPTSGANVSCAPAVSTTPVACTIEVDWTEKVVASNAANTNSTPTVYTYQLLVMP